MPDDMTKDHTAWRGDHDRWRAAIAALRADHLDALSVLRRAEAAMHAHEAGMVRLEAEAAAHDAAMAAHEADGTGDAGRHDAHRARHAETAERLEAARTRHGALMAQVRALVAALDAH